MPPTAGAGEVAVEVDEEQLEGQHQQVTQFLLLGQLPHLAQPVSLVQELPQLKRLLFHWLLFYRLLQMALAFFFDLRQGSGVFLLGFLVEVDQPVGLELLHFGPLDVRLVGVEVGVAFAEGRVGEAVEFVDLGFLGKGLLEPGRQRTDEGEAVEAVVQGVRLVLNHSIGLRELEFGLLLQLEHQFLLLRLCGRWLGHHLRLQVQRLYLALQQLVRSVGLGKLGKFREGLLEGYWSEDGVVL